MDDQRRKKNVYKFQKPRKQKRRYSLSFSKLIIPIIIAIVAVGYVANERYGFLAQLGPLDSAKFPICGPAKRYTCTVDGDTVWLRGEKIRLKGIDAPEVSQPKCGSEAALAARATSRLGYILSANEWVISRSGKDRYGRTLAQFWIGNKTAGDMLVKEGLARKWRGHKEDWC